MSPEDRELIDAFEQIHLIREHLACLERPTPRLTARVELLCGQVFNVTGDCAAAAVWFERAVALHDAHGMADIASFCRIYEARCRLALGDGNGAARRYREVLTRETTPMTDDHVTECLEAAEYLLLRHHLIADVDADEAASTAAEVAEQVARIESQYDGRLSAVTRARHLVVRALAGLHTTPAGSIEQLDTARTLLQESNASSTEDPSSGATWTHALLWLCSGMIARETDTRDEASAAFSSASAWFVLAGEARLARHAAELMVATASQPEPESAQGELDLR